MDLSVIIVSYKVKDKLQKNLKSLFESRGDFSMEVFVVDNDSQDGTIEMVQDLFPQVKLIQNSKNLGFSKANNLAIKQSSGDFILLLNPDMQVFPETLSNTLSFAKNNPQATVSSCQLINEKGENIKHIRRFPKFFDQAMVILKIPHLFPAVLNKYLVNSLDYSVTQKVDSVRGSFFLINKHAYQRLSKEDLPLLDERYFIWFEEVDFCREVYRLGGEVWYNHQVKCLDYIGQSFSLVSKKEKQRLFRNSMLQYFEKWEAKWKYRGLKFLWSLIFIVI